MLTLKKNRNRSNGSGNSVHNVGMLVWGKNRN